MVEVCSLDQHWSNWNPGFIGAFNDLEMNYVSYLFLKLEGIRGQIEDDRTVWKLTKNGSFAVLHIALSFSVFFNVSDGMTFFTEIIQHLMATASNVHLFLSPFVCNCFKF